MVEEDIRQRGGLCKSLLSVGSTGHSVNYTPCPGCLKALVKGVLAEVDSRAWPDQA